MKLLAMSPTRVILRWLATVGEGETLYVHSLDPAAELVALQYTRNRCSRPSAMFRRLRRLQQFSVFGDYPLMYTLFSTTARLGVPLSRQQIRHCLNQSEQLALLTRSERRRLLDSLEESSRPWDEHQQAIYNDQTGYPETLDDEVIAELDEPLDEQADDIVDEALDEEEDLDDDLDEVADEDQDLDDERGETEREQVAIG
jgi:hypothetical protein